MITLFTIAGREARIHVLPGRPRFMLAADLAELYGTKAMRLGEAVKRNPDRFPEDFCFRLTEAEAGRLSQIAITSPGTRTDLRPLVFTHIGAYALSGVLKSDIAAQVSVEIHRAFAAMEAKAIAEVKYMLGKLRSQRMREKPINMLVADAARQGWSLEQTWRAASYPRHKVETAAKEMHAVGVIDRLLAGMQDDLFSFEG